MITDIQMDMALSTQLVILMQNIHRISFGKAKTVRYVVGYVVIITFLKSFEIHALPSVCHAT